MPAATTATAAAAAAAAAVAAAAATKKRRCWQFHVSGVSPAGTKAQQQSALASFTDKYTAAKRLTIIPAPADPAATTATRINGAPSGAAGTNAREPRAGVGGAGGEEGCGTGGAASTSGSVVVEVQFSGPQPAERPALLLRKLLGGKTVAAHPVLLRRGRNKKTTEADAAAAAAAAGDGEKSGGGVRASVEVSRSSGALVDATGVVIEEASCRHDLKRTATSANLSSPRTDPEADDDAPDRGAGRDVCFPTGDKSGGGGGGGGESENEMLLSDVDMDDADDDDGLGHAFAPGFLCGAWDRCMDLSSWNPVDEGSDTTVQDCELGGKARVRSSCDCALGCDCCNADRDSNTDDNLGWSINLGGVDDFETTDTATIRDHRAADVGSRDGALPLPPRRSSSDTNLFRASGATPTRGKRPSLSTLAAHAPAAPSLRRRRSSHNMTSAGAVTGHEARVHGSSERDAGGPKTQKSAPWNGCGFECLLAEGVAGRDGVEFQALPKGSGWGGGADAAASEGAAAKERRLGNEEPHQEFSRRRRRRRGGMREEKLDAVSVEPLLEEFDFEGHPAKLYNPMDSPFAEAFSVPRGEEQYLVFTGLEAVTEEPLQKIAARVQFSVASREVVREIDSLQAGANGRVYGAVDYPSMKELWPEIYNTLAVRVVEVKLLVDIRPRDGDFLRITTELKAMYRRPQLRGKGYDGAQWRP